MSATITLDQALDVLIRVHTRDDPKTGFAVETGAAPHHVGMPQSDYVQAWRVVREYNHFRTEPEHYPSENGQ